MKKIIAISVVVLALLAMGFTLVRNKATLESKNVLVDRTSMPVSVSLITVTKTAAADQLKGPATLYAVEEASISPSASGRITSLSLELGTYVQKGQVMGHLDVEELQMKLESAEMAADKLQKEYDRNKVLAEGNATTSKALQDSKYDLDSKVIETKQLRKQILNANIIAPITGIISEKSKEQGENVSTGEVIGKIVNTSSLKARVYLPENKVFRLKAGQIATITTEVFAAETFGGKVTFISPQGDNNHNYLVELAVDNNKTSRLKAGMYAIVTFDMTESSSVIQIPKSALVDGVKNPYVYIADNDKAVETKIKLGREFGDYIEVVDGLTEGQQVIVSGQINVVNGSNVKAVTSK